MPRPSREVFEERVYAIYFISQVERTGLGGCMELGIKVDTMTKAELCARDPENPDDYEHPHISAMWWAWNEALKHMNSE